jgi:hypothetical protein
MGLEIIIAVVVIGAIALFLVWRTVRFIVRLLLFGLLIILLLIGAYAWLYGFGVERERPIDNRPVKRESIR